MSTNRAIRAEAPRHFLDIDIYGPYPFVELPHNYDDAVAKFGVEIVTKRGLATWRIAEYTQLLSEAMKSGDAQKIVQTAGALAHYVEDIHMPLHVVKNYNGQLTNQHGVHQRFEDDMVDAYAEQIHLTPKDGDRRLKIRWKLLLTLYSTAMYTPTTSSILTAGQS